MNERAMSNLYGVGLVDLDTSHPQAWLPFYATAIHAQAVEQLQAGTDTLYAALLEDVIPYLSGAAFGHSYRASKMGAKA